MGWVRFAVLVVVAAVLQASLVDVIAVTRFHIKPDLLLVLLVFFAVHCDPTEVIITSFCIGLVADIIGPMMGPRMISFGLIGTLLADLNRVVVLKKMSYQWIAIFLVGFLTASVAWFLAFLRAEAPTSGIYTEFFWTPLYSAIIGPFLFSPMQWWMRMKKRKVRRF
jgi:rod shape-determining protein MreD